MEKLFDGRHASIRSMLNRPMSAVELQAVVHVQLYERLVMLRVVGCLPSVAELSGYTKTMWAGVGQALTSAELHVSQVERLVSVVKRIVTSIVFCWFLTAKS